MKALIIANGQKPSKKLLEQFSQNADLIIATDGAGSNFYADVIIGDLDSLKQPKNPNARIISRPTQESNDLSKAFKYALDCSATSIDILGACGRRDDHFIANFALFMKFCAIKTARDKSALSLRMHSDYGSFCPLRHKEILQVQKGAQISLFSPKPNLKITSSGLKFKLKNLALSRLNEGSLNEAISSQISLEFNQSNAYVIAYISPLKPKEQANLKSLKID